MLNGLRRSLRDGLKHELLLMLLLDDRSGPEEVSGVGVEGERRGEDCGLGARYVLVTQDSDGVGRRLLGEAVDGLGARNLTESNGEK